jgi:hypothetical protein
MNKELVPVDELERQLPFLNGYLFREMVSMLRAGGPESTGLYSYYKARIEREQSALSGYDLILYSYMLERFSREDRQIVHAGIGLGTLASALAQGGFMVVGIESDERRFQAANRLRAALLEAWPCAADRYTLIFGEFPGVLDDTDWTTTKSILVFTNCGAGWSDQLTANIISQFSLFGDVILDSRLFGRVRDEAEERDTLMRQIEEAGLVAIPIPETAALGAFYYHLQAAKVRTQ